MVSSQAGNPVGSKLKRIYIIIGCVIIALLGIVYLVSGGCGNFDREKAHEISLRAHVRSLIYRLSDYSAEFGGLPLDVSSLPEYVKKECLEKSKYSEGCMYFSKEGFKDQSGKKWLVVLIDNMNPGQYYTGTIIKSKVIITEEIAIIKNDKVLEKEISLAKPAVFPAGADH